MKTKEDLINLFFLVNNNTIINLNNLVLMAKKEDNYLLQFTDGISVNLTIDVNSNRFWNYLNSIAFQLSDGII